MKIDVTFDIGGGRKLDARHAAITARQARWIVRKLRVHGAISGALHRDNAAGVGVRVRVVGGTRRLQIAEKVGPQVTAADLAAGYSLDFDATLSRKLDITSLPHGDNALGCGAPAISQCARELGLGQAMFFSIGKKDVHASNY